MLLTKAESPPDGPRWAFEVKWDGFRCLSYLGGGRPRFVSQRGADLSQYFPELSRPPWLRDSTAVLDGELVALVDGRPSFTALRDRGGAWSPLESSGPDRFLPPWG
jgi:bifunctional non-homologous end joining protein LigD